MKGLIFTEFIEMVEDKFGFVVADELISNSSLPSGGIYTSVGTYDIAEMIELLVNLNKLVKIEIPDLVYAFGEYLFARFATLYKGFFEGKSNSLDFLEDLESYIHMQVLKLYPDAELPKFDIKRVDTNKLEMVYRSKRKLGQLALGLINGCGNHFNEKLNVEQELIREDGSEIRFLITKLA